MNNLNVWVYMEMMESSIIVLHSEGIWRTCTCITLRMKNTVKIDQLPTAMSAICIINHKCQSFICNSCAAFVLSSTILYFLGERKTKKKWEKK